MNGEILLHDYNLAWNQVERLIARRQNVTTTYLSVNAAIFASVGFLIKDAPHNKGVYVSVIVLLIAGLGSCEIWRQLIHKYSGLLRWWYTQLRDMEQRIEGSWKLANLEYNDLYIRNRGNNRFLLTQYEVGLTSVFALVYIIFALGLVIYFTN